MRRIERWAVLVIAIAVVCILMAIAHVPSPLLFGGLIGALGYSLLYPRPAVLPRAAYLLAQATIGLSVAAQVDWESLKAFAADWPAILLVTVATLLVSVLAGQVLRLHGVSPATATFSSIAGGAAGMAALAEDMGADSRVVTVIQYLRVLVILLTLPAIVGIVFAPERTSGIELASASPTASDYVFVGLAIALGIGFGMKTGIPSPAVLGTLLVGIALILTPWFVGSIVPAWVQATAFVLIGAQVGLRFTKGSLAAIGRMLPTALVVIFVVIAACGGLGVLLAWMTGESQMDAYLATSPGGLPAVIAASTGTDSNLTFISAVQLIRILLVLMLAPVVTKLVLRTDKG